MNKRNIVYLLLSIVLAFALWVYVVTVVSPESEETFYDVPVEFKNEMDEELVLMSEAVPTVTLKLIGNRSDLARLNKSNITVQADLGRLVDPGSFDLPYDVSFPAEVGSVGLLSKNPSTLHVVVERKLIDKPVDVVIVPKGAVPVDCIIQEEILSSSQVLVSGPKSVVDKITQARIEVDYTDQEKTFDQTAKPTLCDKDGNPVDAKMVETDIGSVDVRVVVRKTKDVELKVRVIDGGGATQMTSDITIIPKKIKVAGTEEDLDALSALDLGTINLADYDEDAVLTLPIKLPAGVKDLGGHESAEVSVKFPELSIVELTVTQFETINVAEGLEAEIFSQALTVKIRGPKTQMENITADDVKIVVDLKGHQEARTFNAAAKVVITNTAYSTAGALDNYSVTVSLQEEKK